LKVFNNNNCAGMVFWQESALCGTGIFFMSRLSYVHLWKENIDQGHLTKYKNLFPADIRPT
jgi:hypothetical protein